MTIILSSREKQIPSQTSGTSTPKEFKRNVEDTMAVKAARAKQCPEKVEAKATPRVQPERPASASDERSEDRPPDAVVG